MLRFCFLCLVFYSFMALRIAQPLLSVCDRTCLSTLVVKLYLLLLSPQAECCGDHMHCCPEGTICNLDQSSCVNATAPSGFAPMLEKVAAFTTAAPSTETATTEKQVTEDKEVEEGKVPCDSHTSCPDHSTCCFMVSVKKWGCCPLPKAVCCSDGNHCCPTNYTCDVNSTTCVKGEVVIPWYTKLPAVTTRSPFDLVPPVQSNTVQYSSSAINSTF
uniref:Granulins domain-containing protein n=1 Tax=Myripristis murdjan TaxID=586833 RepID=A0A667Z4T5_9TELE